MTDPTREQVFAAIIGTFTDKGATGQAAVATDAVMALLNPDIKAARTWNDTSEGGEFWDRWAAEADSQTPDPEVHDQCGQIVTEGRRCAVATLPVIAKALLAPLRELHKPVTQSFTVQSMNDVPAQMTMRTHCAICATFYTYPCPTVRLLDAIEAEVQP